MELRRCDFQRTGAGSHVDEERSRGAWSSTRNSYVNYQFPVIIRHGHPEPREGSCVTRADSSLRSE
ncbi:MAG: hypothetical protein C0183_19110 [Roseiflexus castenholzii]|nr:MAG: hypothetical protein C0183_19110 [Roseiflexus castenholzii]